jgi:riboflavin kinase/FMN adenylyltransferase
VRVVAGLEQLDHSTEPVFVVVGVFDGLHQGHAYLLRHLVAEASRLGARPVVITFDHHPDEVLVGNAPPLLCDPGERLARLAAAGVDTTVVVHFDQRLRETTYGAFVAMVEERAPVAGFLMTPDAAFGYQRAGTPEALAALGGERGFEVVVVPPFDIDGRPVRSSEVRSEIAAGDLAAAARLLGRSHTVVGEAIPAGEGSVLRFALPVALPPDGEYAVTAGPASSHAGGELRTDEEAVEDRAAGRAVAVVDGATVLVRSYAGAGLTRIAFVGRVPDAGER